MLLEQLSHCRLEFYVGTTFMVAFDYADGIVILAPAPYANITGRVYALTRVIMILIIMTRSRRLMFAENVDMAIIIILADDNLGIDSQRRNHNRSWTGRVN